MDDPDAQGEATDRSRGADDHEGELDPFRLENQTDDAGKEASDEGDEVHDVEIEVIQEVLAPRETFKPCDRQEVYPAQAESDAGVEASATVEVEHRHGDQAYAERDRDEVFRGGYEQLRELGAHAFVVNEREEGVGYEERREDGVTDLSYGSFDHRGD